MLSVQNYEWVKQYEALTVSVVKDRDRDDVLRIFGADPSNPVVGYYAFSQLPDLQGDGVMSPLGFFVQAFQLRTDVVVLENNGWTGGTPETARRCSADGGLFFSVFWNANAQGTVLEARDGKVTALVEHLYPLLPVAYPHEVRPEWAIGEAVDVDDAQAKCFQLMETQTGVHINSAWFAQKRQTFEVPDPTVLFADVEGADQP